MNVKAHILSRNSYTLVVRPGW